MDSTEQIKVKDWIRNALGVPTVQTFEEFGPEQTRFEENNKLRSKLYASFRAGFLRGASGVYSEDEITLMFNQCHDDTGSYTGSK